MDRLAQWETVPVPELDALPSVVSSRSQALLPRQVFPVHTHRWNQLVYATSGALIVAADDARHVITPEQAIWIPTGARHSTGALNGAAFRNLYIADLPDLGMPDACAVLAVGPLMRALILERERCTLQGEQARYIDQLNALILEQLRRLPVLDFHLPWPRGAGLQQLCEALYGDPADARSLHDWGRLLGASERTLARRFETELGMSLREWRHHLRVFLAVEWLGAGRSVTEVALALGYASTAAFSYMFRRAMGCAPTEWLARLPR